MSSTLFILFIFFFAITTLTDNHDQKKIGKKHKKWKITRRQIKIQANNIPQNQEKYFKKKKMGLLCTDQCR